MKKRKKGKMRYTEKYKVTSHDVDVNNNMKPSLVLRYMQETANHQMRDRKPSYYELFFAGKSFIITRITIEVYEQIHQYDEIEVATWRCPEKGATFIRCYEITCDNRVCARAYSVWAVTNHQTGKLCKASEVDISNYDTDEPLSLSLPNRFRLPKTIDYIKAGEKEVFYSDVDMNLHMNNTHYPDMLWNFIPDVMSKEVTSVNLRFMKEAPLGGKVEIYMGKMDVPLSEDSEAEETWCFASKVEGEINVEAQIGVKRLER